MSSYLPRSLALARDSSRELDHWNNQLGRDNSVSVCLSVAIPKTKSLQQENIGNRLRKRRRATPIGRIIYQHRAADCRAPVVFC